MMQDPLTLVIADDERPARRFLTGMLKVCPNVELLGEATSGAEALALIQTHRPQLALLDLQMPEIGGLDVVRRLSPPVLPLIAFVTAFDDHAIEAFELNAIDYLLKPVQQHRLQATLDRARERLRNREPVESRAAALASASGSGLSCGRMTRGPARSRTCSRLDSAPRLLAVAMRQPSFMAPGVPCVHQPLDGARPPQAREWRARRPSGSVAACSPRARRRRR